MAQYTVKCTDGSVRHVDAHSVSQVAGRMLFHVRDERQPVFDLESESVAEVRRRIVEPNGMMRTVAARVGSNNDGRSR